MQNPWHFFDKIYCINLDKRADRWAQAQEQFKKLGIKVERFSAHEGENKHLAFNSSQYHVIKKAIDDGCKRFLILEDDVVFSNASHLRMVLQQLPYNWDALYLGGNVIGSDVTKWAKPTKISNNLCRLWNAWQTQSVGYSRKGGQFILDNFDYTKFPIFDEWLRTRMMTDKLVYIANPQMTYQVPGFSDIWGRETNYTSVLAQGNKIMSA